MTIYNSIDAIDAQIEELKKRRDALASGLCYIPLPSYNSTMEPYGLSCGIDTFQVENKTTCER